MAQTEALFSSLKTDYETPDVLFNYWNAIFEFDLDAAANETNAKCPFNITRAWRAEPRSRPPSPSTSRSRRRDRYDRR